MPSTIDTDWPELFADLIQPDVSHEATTTLPEAKPLWAALSVLGTEPWLDTGDLQAAEQVWDPKFQALTTNNSLLNKEVQQGSYDDLIRIAGQRCQDHSLKQRILLIGLLLNVHHALLLTRRFGCRVSVELHTDLANDEKTSVAIAHTIHAIAPDRFIIKVPLTPAGLFAIRRLQAQQIPVNCTLGCSARQNYLAARFAQPEFVNVFLGRLSSFASQNKLGSGHMLGEKATLASQRAIREVNQLNESHTRQIAASMRDGDQVRSLAGVDVMTMPTKVAAAALQSIEPDQLTDATQEDPAVELEESAVDSHIEKLWVVSDAVRDFSAFLHTQPPTSVEEMVDGAHHLGLGDLFPRWEPADWQRLEQQGKIPDWQHWRHQLTSGSIGVDALISAAGLTAFRSDQQALDKRIEKLLDE